MRRERIAALSAEMRAAMKAIEVLELTLSSDAEMAHRGEIWNAIDELQCERKQLRMRINQLRNQTDDPWGVSHACSR